MSIRSRIEKFEALARDRDQANADSDSKSKHQAKSVIKCCMHNGFVCTGKRFRLPGKSSEADTQPTGSSFIINSRSPKKNGLQSKM